jgi:hypothetical protein
MLRGAIPRRRSDENQTDQVDFDENQTDQTDLDASRPD